MMKKQMLTVLIQVLVVTVQSFATNTYNVVRVGTCPSYNGKAAQTVAVSGNYAYVANSQSGLLVVDVSTPSNPAIEGRLDTTHALGVAVAGNYAYVGDYSSGLRVIDVSDPGNPVLESTYITAGYAVGVAVEGSYAYVACDASGLQVIDVSNPAMPVWAGGYDTSGNAYDVTVAGSYAYVADGGAGLQIIDVSDPLNPVRVGGYDTPGNAQIVVVSGPYAYVADYASGWTVIDVSDPAAPVPAGGYPLSDGLAEGCAVAGGYVFGVGGGGSATNNGLKVFDAGNPTNLVYAGGYTYAAASFLDVEVAGNYAYVAANTEGLVVFEMGAPGAVADTDSDGMDDAWEMAQFGNLDQSADGDYDADGRTNAEEETDGTDPTDPGSTLGLVAYYPFDGDADDASGNGNDAILVGTGTGYGVDRFGDDGRAIRTQGNVGYYGSGNGIEIPNSLSNADKVSIGVWSCIDSVTEQESIVAFGSHDVDMDSVDIYVNPGMTEVGFRLVDGITQYVVTHDFGRSFSGEFHHFSMVVDTELGSLSGYVDATFVGDVSIPVTELTTDARFANIHKHYWDVDGRQSSTRINGISDDVRIYNRALSSNEVVRLYESTAANPDTDGDGMDDAWEMAQFGNLDQSADGDYDADGRTNAEEEIDGTDPTDAGSTLGLVAYYPFDGDATDASGNGYNGTVYGGATTDGVLSLGNNTTDYLSIPNTVFSGLTDLTFCVYAKLDSLQVELNQLFCLAQEPEINHLGVNLWSNWRATITFTHQRQLHLPIH